MDGIGRLYLTFFFAAAASAALGSGMELDGVKVGEWCY